MRALLSMLRTALESELFQIAGTPISGFTLVSVVAILLATIWFSRMLRRVVERLMTRRGGRQAVVGTVTGLVHYAVLLTGFGVALDTAGIDLTALFAAGAIFAVGIGFAMQSIAQNFVAGVILITERAIKPGDILEVEGTLVRVQDMGIRACIAQTRDGEDLIIPNSTLIQTTVKNYTLREPTFRMRVEVGVTYDSDMRLVKRTLERLADAFRERWSVKGRETQVVLTSFGDHAVNWQIATWINDPWAVRQAMSDLNEEVWWAFEAEGIVIAFHQLDVHFDPPVSDSLARFGERTAA